MADKLTLGAQRLLAWRLERSLTQHDVGKLLDLTTNDISRYENGHKVPLLPTILRMLDVCDIEVRLWVTPPDTAEAA